jgi:uncharacterized protein
MKHWVIDTNVIVSGLLMPSGPPVQVVDAITQGFIKVAYDERILDEYRDVLNRRQLNLVPLKIARFLATLRSHRMVFTTQRLAAGPDPADLMFIEVALETPQKTIVTGNLKDFPSAIRHGVRVLTPAQAVTEL